MGNFDVGDEKSNFEGRFTAYVSSMFDPSLTWADIDWLRGITNLPILVKGILRPDDAEIALQHGVSAIVVSNHGGRQLDGVLATVLINQPRYDILFFRKCTKICIFGSKVDALPAIVKQVNGRCEVFVDGGISHGTDILKVLALGAKMV